MKVVELIISQNSLSVTMKNFLKTTIATFDEEKDEPVITYEDVDVSLIPPRKRDYTTKQVKGAKNNG